MDNGVRIELVDEGVRELLKEVGSTECVRIASEAAGRLGEGYESKQINYPERVTGIVKAVSHEALKQNEENNSLIKAVFRK